MRIINKPDLKQTLITTGTSFVAGFISSVILLNPSFQPGEAIQLPGLGLAWGLAMAWSVRHMPGARRNAVFVFPFVTAAGWACFMIVPLLVSSLSWIENPDNKMEQLTVAILAACNLWLFSGYYRRKVPFLNYAIAFGLGWLGMEVVMFFSGCDTDEYAPLIPRGALQYTTWCTFMTLGIALSLPKPRSIVGNEDIATQ